MYFFSTIGRLPNTWLALSVTILAGLSEGFGITLFVPLLEIMSGSTDEPSRLFVFIRDMFEGVGLPFTLTSTLTAIIVMVVGGFSITYVQRRILMKAKYRCAETMRRDVIGSLMHSSWTHLTKQGQGEVINHLIVEITRASTGLQVQIILLAAFVQVMILAAISAILSWHLILLSLLFAGTIALITLPIIRRAEKRGEASNRANRDYSFHAIDYMRGARLIKAAGAEASVLSRIGEFSRSLFNAQVNLEHNSLILYLIVQTAPVIIIGIIIFVAHQILALSTSHILVFLVLLARIAPRVAEIQTRHENYSGYAPAIRLLDQAIETAEAERENLGESKAPIEGLTDTIRLQDVSYRYPDSAAAAVKNVSLIIPAKQMVAFVGKSGSGKSTLMDLIVGLRHPDSGSVVIDGSNLRDINLMSWRHKIGYVTQDVIIFNDTLRNNLLFSHPDTTTEEIDEALRIAHLTDVVRAMPEGLDTVLGEGGIRLSGGQKQRVALARALIGKPDLLFFDEATSSLDSESERMIQDAIGTIAHRFTIIIIAHRLSTVRMADLICVMDGGRIVERGTHDDLFAKDGHFSHLYKLQFV